MSRLTLAALVSLIAAALALSVTYVATGVAAWSWSVAAWLLALLPNYLGLEAIFQNDPEHIV